MGIGKASVSESLLKCRNWLRWHQNRGVSRGSGMSLAGARLLARRCPACRRREPGLRLLHGTWEGRPDTAARLVHGWGREGVFQTAETVRN